jgi:hypothetical protein
VRVDGDPALTLKFPAPVTVAHEVATYRVFTVTPATHYSTRALVEHFGRVVDEGKKEVAIRLLKVFDPNIEDLDVVASLSREAVVLALTRASQGVLLVDEIEAGVHHSVLRQVLSKLLEAAAALGVQLLAMTHSLEAVDAIIGCTEEMGATETLGAFWVKRVDGKHGVQDVAEAWRKRADGEPELDLVRQRPGHSLEARQLWAAETFDGCGRAGIQPDGGCT